MFQDAFPLGDCLPTLTAPTGAARPDAGSSLRLRWLTAADLAALYAIFSDAEVTRYWGSARFTKLADAEALLESIQSHFRARTLFQWGIELADGDSAGQIIGTCTLAHIDPVNRRGELGFALGRSHWGHGYARTAAAAVLAFAFEQLQLHRVSADTDPRNAASIRTLEKLGFRREGLLREHYHVTGEIQDALLFGLLRSEWQASPANPRALR
jgi:ribosomal-protein-alanine N-acetyltransferase